MVEVFTRAVKLNPLNWLWVSRSDALYGAMSSERSRAAMRVTREG